MTKGINKVIRFVLRSLGIPIKNSYGEQLGLMGIDPNHPKTCQGCRHEKDTKNV